MAKEKKFKVKKKFTFSDMLLHGLLRIFNRKPKAIVNLSGGELPKQCILIANHFGSKGPVSYRLFLRNVYMTWSAHQMCEGYGSRYNYLYHIYYRKKQGYGKLKAFFKSVLLASVAPWTYKYAGVLPVYYDNRLFRTYKYSIEAIENEVPVFIFPENSNEGYKETLEEFWPGFLALPKLYFKKHNVDLPMYCLRLDKNPKRIIIGKPMYYNALAKEHSDEEIIKIFVNYINSLQEIKS
jgi:hypothetical protein